MGANYQNGFRHVVFKSGITIIALEQLMNLEQMLSQTGQRAITFRFMVDYLSELNQPLVVETGCARIPDNFIGDGMSTLIFDAAVAKTNGRVLSVDLNADHVRIASDRVSNRTKVECSDSVKFLWNLKDNFLITGERIDLLYLDSFDFNVSDPVPSSLHHMKELAAILPVLKPNSIIVVDDNFKVPVRSGKGCFVHEFLSNIGCPLLYDEYQMIWKYTIHA